MNNSQNLTMEFSSPFKHLKMNNVAIDLYYFYIDDFLLLALSMDLITFLADMVLIFRLFKVIKIYHDFFIFAPTTIIVIIFIATISFVYPFSCKFTKIFNY